MNTLETCENYARFKTGGFYQGQVFIYDYWKNMRDTFFHPIIQVITVDRKKEDYEYDVVRGYTVFYGREVTYHTEAIRIRKPNERGYDGIDEACIIKVKSYFGWVEGLIFDAGFVLSRESAQRRMNRIPHMKTDKEIFEEIVGSEHNDTRWSRAKRKLQKLYELP